MRKSACGSPLVGASTAASDAEADAVVRSQIAAQADLRNPQPEIAGSGELGKPDGAPSEDGFTIRDGWRLLAHRTAPQRGQRQLGEGAAEPEQGKGAAAAARLLAAEEVNVQLAAERATPELRVPGRPA